MFQQDGKYGHEAAKTTNTGDDEKLMQHTVSVSYNTGIIQSLNDFAAKKRLP